MKGLSELALDDFNFVYSAHQKHPTEAKKAFRKWDKRTPYFIHPIWCATTILTETRLDEKTRIEGYYALLYHDILEDTTVSLPLHLNGKIGKLVKDMTFEGGSKQEMHEIWQKPREVRLYKLYDKVSNLLYGSWMDNQKRGKYLDYLKRLIQDVRADYGELNILAIAGAIGGFRDD